MQLGEVGSECVLHVHRTSQVKRAAYRCTGNGGVKVEALHLHLLGVDFKVNVRRVEGNLLQAGGADLELDRSMPLLRLRACAVNAELQVEITVPGALLPQRRQVQIGDIERAAILRRRSGRIEMALESYMP